MKANFKTTLIAFIGAVLNGVNFYFGNIVPSEIAIPITILGVALVTKDYDTTGVGSTATKENGLT
jgi:hypothetical protein